MANQIIIDIGAVANDGTGDPLRTAFNYVNDNFSNVWATGVANSNVAFSGNKILTTNTNGNLVLAPNGTGKVQANVDIVPNANNTLSLGGLAKRWNTVYAQYLDVANITVSGDVDLAGDVVIDGNLTVNGTTTTLNTSNVDIEDKQITLAFGSPNASVATGAGIHVAGANANITYLSSNDSWNLNKSLSVNGNISTFIGNVQATHFIGNGSQLTSVAAAGGNGQIQFNNNGLLGVASYGLTYDNDSNTFNVVTGSFFGNLETGRNAVYAGTAGYTALGSDIMIQVTGNVDAYSQINFQNINSGNSASGDYIITADNGTDSTNFVDLGIASSNYAYPSYPAYGPNDSYLLNNGANLLINAQSPGKVIKLLVGGSANSNIVATVSNIGMDIKGNIIPTTSNVYSLGNATNQWSDLYVSNATIYMNNVPVSLTAGNVLTVNSQPVLINDSSTSITTTGNITADFFIGDGSQLTNLPFDASKIENGTSNVEIATANGNVTVTANGSSTWNFATDGKLTAPGEVYGQFYTIRGGNGPGTDIGSLGYAGNIVDVYGVEGVRISTIDESGPFWQFDITGNLAIPGTIVSDSTVRIDNRESGNTADIQLYSADDILLQARDRSAGSGSEGGDINIYAGDSAEDGDASGGDITIEAGNGGAANVDNGGSGGFVTVQAGAGGDASTQEGGLGARNGGSLTLNAGGAGSNMGNIDRGSGGGDVTISAGDSTGNNSNGGEVSINTGAGGANALSGGLYINIPESDQGTGGAWVFSGSGQQLTVPPNAEIYGPSFGNLTMGAAGNVILTSSDYIGNTYYWRFGSTGNLTAPGDVEIGTGNSGVQLRSNQTGNGFYATIAGITNGSSTVVVTLNDVEFGEGDQGTVTITGVVGETEANGFWGWRAVEVDQIQLYTNDTFSTPVDGTTWGAYGSGGVAVSSGYNELDIQGGSVAIISGAGKYWSFAPNGTTIFPTLTVTRGDRTGTLTGQALVFGDATQEALISTPNGTADINASQRFVINPGTGYANTTGEGGDIYLYAGRGGDAGGSGGDIKIRGGLGPVDGDGGYIDITGGEAEANGSGGYIDIRGGQSGNAAGGAVRIIAGQGLNGAEANLIGGVGTAGSGGAVNIAGGVSSNGVAEYGNVNITSGASTWTFNNTGNLTVPNIIQGSADSDYALKLGAFPEEVDAGRWLQVRSGDVADHIHFDTSNNSAWNFYVGSDNQYVLLGNTGNISIGSYDSGNSTTHQWLFDNAGTLTAPGNITTAGTGGDVTLTGGNITGANVVTANTFVGSGANLTDVATTVTGGWVLNTGTNTANITVPLNGTYSMWVRGNIPNGIVVWNATVTVTNNNVPAIGQQFAWYYPAPGNALVLTSIPAQIIGTANTISNSTPVVGTTTNVFEFTIDNNSGNSQVVDYGYTKIG